MFPGSSLGDFLTDTFLLFLYSQVTIISQLGLAHRPTEIHINFMSELSAGQVSLMAYMNLPGYNLGYLYKSAEL